MFYFISPSIFFLCHKRYELYRYNYMHTLLLWAIYSFRCFLSFAFIVLVHYRRHSFFYYSALHGWEYTHCLNQHHCRYPAWLTTVKAKYDAFMNNDTFTLDPLPPNRVPIGCNFGFSSSKCHPSLFVYSKGSTTVYMLIYVDDIIIIGNNPTLLQSLVWKLNSVFSLKNLGSLDNPYF